MHDTPLVAGIIGAGRAGARRARGLQGLDGVHLAWMTDTDAAQLDPERLEVPANTRLLTDSRQALREDPVDLVCICTPPASHEAYALEAMAQGVRHLLVEKPVTCTAEGARRLWEAANACGAHVKVGSNLRRFAEIRELLELVAAGTLGPLREAAFSIGHDGRNLPGWSYHPPIAGGGTLLDNGVHIIDLALQLGAIPARFEVRGELDWHGPGIDREARWELAADGTRCAFTSSWGRRDNVYVTARLDGEEGTATLVVSGDGSSLSFEGAAGSFVTRYEGGGDSWGEDTRAFVDAVRRSGRAGATLLDGRRAVGLVEQVYRAAKTGGAVVATLEAAGL